MSKTLLIFLLLQLAAASTVVPQKRYFGLNPAFKRDYPYAKRHQASFGDRIPYAWDWRDHGYVTPVKSQECGDCYIFSALEALEGQWRRVHGVLNSLSEQNVLDCDVGGHDHGCGWPANVYDFVRREGGVETEKDYPYVAYQHSNCSYNASAAAATVTGYTEVDETDADLLHAVATVGPISVAVDAHNWPGDFTGGISDGFNCSTEYEDLTHGVLLVGYGSENGVPFWIIKNSWGTGWGEEGYIRLRRDIPNNCGITNAATYPNV